MRTEEIRGLFISLSPAEHTEIMEGLEDAGYTPDPSGAKAFLFDTLREPEAEEEPQPRPGSTIGPLIAEYLRNHPEAAEQLKAVSGELRDRVMRSIMSRIKKGHP